MKKGTIIFSLLLVLGLLWIVSGSSCQNENRAAERAQNELNRAGENLKDAAKETGEALRIERDELGEQMRQQARELDQAIAELDKKIERAADKEKARWVERRNALERDRQELNKDLKRLGENIEDGWDNFKDDVAYRMERIAENLREN